MLTNLRRYATEPDIVLVTPQRGLCPDCTRAGYDRRTGGSNPPPKTASCMPRDFEELPRMEMSKMDRVSAVPSSSLRPVSPSRIGASQRPSAIYDPAASRMAPKSKKSESGREADLSYTGISITAWPKESHRRERTQASKQSSQPRQSRSPSVISSKPVTTIHDPRLKIVILSSRPTASSPHKKERTVSSSADPNTPASNRLPGYTSITPPSELSPPGGTRYPEKRSKHHGRAGKSNKTESESPLPKHEMSPAELLKRGPPRNVNASAFYDTPDGVEARARAKGRR